MTGPAVDLRTNMRAWSTAEKQLLRKYYPVGGLTACRTVLESRSDKSITQCAWQLGLRVVDGDIKPTRTADGIAPQLIDPLCLALEEFKRCNEKAVTAIAERARAFRAYAHLRARIATDGNHQRRVS